MLGQGHAPPELLAKMAEPWVMANVMTPSFSQKRLADRLRREIGRSQGGCPFHRFICMNSGSEAVAVAARIADINARRQTDPEGPYAGWTIRRLSLVESFHGRTTRPARASHATRALYESHLASFRDVDDDLVVVEPNDVGGLRQAFAEADREQVFFEACYLEPVLGEGTPGLGLTREFYDAARALTAERGTTLIVDSIQAAIRAHGCLSIVDYPGFEGCAPPDLETYSKALNAGQYPLSVLALREPMAEQYVKGIYGNTMTTNPRALEVACGVLDALTDELRANIRDRGRELVDKLEALARQHPDAVRGVSGTGLMVNVELDPERYPVTGEHGFEKWLRRHGVSMIHGGKNGLRFTPAFDIGAAEVDLIARRVEQGLHALG
jgi:acetylornithine/succinyldiaminopimelate/putrescine aminotransferase